MNAINDTILQLFEELDRLSEIYEELTDTDVREALHETLNYFFIWGKTHHTLPHRYKMFSPEADAAIASAVQKFFLEINQLDDLSKVPIGQSRLDLLQDSSLVTSGGCQYDDFIGYTETPLPPEFPDELYAEPDYY